MDDLDRKLLAALQQDASESLEKLGERVGLSRNDCWTRVRGLEEAGGLKARVALLDPKKVILALSVFIAVRTKAHDPDWLETFARIVSGDLDYLIRARVPDVEA